MPSRQRVVSLQRLTMSFGFDMKSPRQSTPKGYQTMGSVGKTSISTSCSMIRCSPGLPRYARFAVSEREPSMRTGGLVVVEDASVPNPWRFAKEVQPRSAIPWGHVHGSIWKPMQNGQHGSAQSLFACNSNDGPNN